MNNTETFNDLKDEIKGVLSQGINELLENRGFWPAWMGEIKWNCVLGKDKHQSSELEALGCKFQKKGSNCVVWGCPEDTTVYSIGEYGLINYYRLRFADGRNYIVSANNETLQYPRVEILNLGGIPNSVKRQLAIELLESLPSKIILKLTDNANEMLSKISD